MSRVKHTAGQKKAYYSGMGYRAAYEGKEIPFKSKKNKQAFKDGFSSVRIIVEKYPDLKSRKSR